MYAKKESLNGYAELFDTARFEQIAHDVESGKGTNGSYSDIECQLYQIMKRLLEANKR